MPNNLKSQSVNNMQVTYFLAFGKCVLDISLSLDVLSVSPKRKNKPKQSQTSPPAPLKSTSIFTHLNTGSQDRSRDVYHGADQLRSWLMLNKRIANHVFLQACFLRFHGSGSKPAVFQFFYSANQQFNKWNNGLIKQGQDASKAIVLKLFHDQFC